MKRPGSFVVWPANLDSTRSRRKGRKLPSSRAVKQPSVKEIFQAATTLGLSPEMAEKAASPKSHWEKLGNVTLKRSGSKAATLRGVSSEILKIRQRASQAPEPKRDKR